MKIIITRAVYLAYGLVKTGLLDRSTQPWMPPQDPKNDEVPSQTQAMVQGLGWLSPTTRFSSGNRTQQRCFTATWPEHCSYEIKHPSGVFFVPRRTIRAHVVATDYHSKTALNKRQSQKLNLNEIYHSYPNNCR